MPKTIRHWKGGYLKDVTPTERIPYDQWIWRLLYIHLYGHLVIKQSESSNPGKQYIFFETEEPNGHYIRTTYGDITVTTEELIILTPNSKYIFGLEEAQELPVEDETN